MSQSTKIDTLQAKRDNTKFSKHNQPSPIAKKLGWAKRTANKTIQGALVAELSREIFDSKTGEVITEAESFAIGLLQEWKTTKDPRYAKLIMDFVAKDNGHSDHSLEPIKVIIQTTPNKD